MTSNRLKKIIQKFLEKYPDCDFINVINPEDIQKKNKKHYILMSNNMAYNSLEFTQLAFNETDPTFNKIYATFALLTSYMDEKFIR